MKLAALREARAASIQQMKDLVDRASKEGRDLSADETKLFDNLKLEERGLSDKIDRAEYLSLIHI